MSHKVSCQSSRSRTFTFERRSQHSYLKEQEGVQIAKKQRYQQKYLLLHAKKTIWQNRQAFVPQTKRNDRDNTKRRDKSSRNQLQYFNKTIKFIREQKYLECINKQLRQL